MATRLHGEKQRQEVVQRQQVASSASVQEVEAALDLATLSHNTLLARQGKHDLAQANLSHPIAQSPQRDAVLVALVSRLLLSRGHNWPQLESTVANEAGISQKFLSEWLQGKTLSLTDREQLKTNETKLRVWAQQQKHEMHALPLDEWVRQRQDTLREEAALNQYKHAEQQQQALKQQQQALKQKHGMQVDEWVRQRQEALQQEAQYQEARWIREQQEAVQQAAQHQAVQQQQQQQPQQQQQAAQQQQARQQQQALKQEHGMHLDVWVRQRQEALQ